MGHRNEIILKGKVKVNKNPIANLFKKEFQAKAEAYNAKAAACSCPEGRATWLRLAKTCEESAFVFELAN